MVDLGERKRLRWPTPDEQRESARLFAERQPIIADAIGAIDGTHVMVRENQDGKHYFVNRIDGIICKGRGRDKKCR